MRLPPLPASLTASLLGHVEMAIERGARLEQDEGRRVPLAANPAPPGLTAHRLKELEQSFGGSSGYAGRPLHRAHLLPCRGRGPPADPLHDDRPPSVVEESLGNLEVTCEDLELVNDLELCAEGNFSLPPSQEGDGRARPRHTNSANEVLLTTQAHSPSRPSSSSRGPGAQEVAASASPSQPCSSRFVSVLSTIVHVDGKPVWEEWSQAGEELVERRQVTDLQYLSTNVHVEGTQVWEEWPEEAETSRPIYIDVNPNLRQAGRLLTYP